MKWRESAKMKLDVCLAEEQRKCEVYCPHCGWKNHIYAFEKDKKLCKIVRSIYSKMIKLNSNTD